MELDNNEWKIIDKALQTWRDEQKITPAQAEELRSSFRLKKTGQQIAQYFFLIALSCTLIAFGAIFIDDKLLERLKNYFSLSNLFISILMGVLSIAWFYYVSRKASALKNAAYEVYVVLGGLSAITCLVYICKDTGFGRSYWVFLALTALLLFTLSLLFRSRALWIGGIAALMGWFGAFTYVFGNNHLFLGMNYPLRFTVFGFLVLLGSFVQDRTEKLRYFQKLSYVAGLIILFTGLWGISVFGNYNDLEAWFAVRQTHILYYGFIFGAAALAALYLGVRYKDDIARDLGILFLLINFYSRYFEYFWNAMHKGVFFLILGISFYLVGRLIEKRRRKEKDLSSQ